VQSSRLAYHAASVTTRRLLLIVTLALAVSLPACTGEDDGGSSTAPSTTSESPLPTKDEKYVFVPGRFTYDFGGITADLSWKGGDGSLKVTNGTDGEVGAPALYVVDQQDQRIDATIDGAAPLGAGDEHTYRVSFPSTLLYEDAGLIVLELGDENYGAMSPLYRKAT
jgi:hypothetical protein